MFERFSDRARHVLVLAQQEARMLDHNFIGTEHLLLGLVREGEGGAARGLASLDVTLEAVRANVRERVGPTGSAPAGSPPFTPRSKKMLELSLREALQLGHRSIGTEHLLLGLLRGGDGVGNEVLTSLGVDRSVLRARALMQAEATARAGPSDVPEGAAGHTMRQLTAGGQVRAFPMAVGDLCAVCGRDLWEVRHYVSAGALRICDQCVATAGAIIKEAEAEGRGPELHLPPGCSVRSPMRTRLPPS
jgi:ATP-dependent Clp protease ATP-binding subunit ClpC